MITAIHARKSADQASIVDEAKSSRTDLMTGNPKPFP
jgi:hypothetical protein